MVENYANARMCRLLSPRLPQWEVCSCIWNHFNSTRNNNQAFNNWRNCVDCHNDFKFISFTVQRKIIEGELFIWLFLFSLIKVLLLVEAYCYNAIFASSKYKILCYIKTWCRFLETVGSCPMVDPQLWNFIIFGLKYLVLS